MNNYYLALLINKVNELKNVLEDIETNNYSDEYKKYLLAGYIITLDSILEIGVGDLHSSKIDSLVSLIYYTRQKIIHYGYFNGLQNTDQIANNIVELTNSFYDSEQEYFSKLVNKNNFELKGKNLLIKAAANIETDGVYYIFKSKDEHQELLIPIEDVFTLTKKSKEKPSKYIVNLNTTGNLFTYNLDGKSSYEQISGLDLKLFLKENSLVLEENYNEHNETIKKIIEEFIKRPVQCSQIMEYASDEQFCKNTIDVIKEFILENSIFEAYIENFYLIKDKYSLNKMQKTDYNKLQNNFRKNILQYMTHKDAFFVNMTIKRTKHYFETLKLSDKSFEIDHYTLAPILIQLFETGPKYFSKQFISSSPEFKKCYSNLLRYRQIFSHYILGDKQYKDALDNFKNEFLSFVKILQMVDLDDVRIQVHEDLEIYHLIEKDKKDFFNYKHEQYLELENGIYVGKKIYYSSKNSNSDKLIGIIPGGNNLHSSHFYVKDAFDEITPLYSIDKTTGLRTHKFVTKDTLPDNKEVKIDCNLSNLFTAYCALNKVKRNGDIQIYFLPSEENGNYAHYDDLETVILRFHSQGYLPVELLTRTTLDTSKANSGIIYLKDCKGNVIANIINKKKQSIHGDYNKDGKRFFSRIDDISHSINRRRHTKW